MNKQGVMEKARQAIQRYAMLRPGDTVLVALSGGADSMTLLCVLLALQQELALREIKALHVNHGLRGEESDRDEAFVRQQCASRGVSLDVCHAQVAAYADKLHKGLEEAGRELRYQFFSSCQQGREDVKIATAHTQSDNMETVLLHLTRGCGTHGLTGIPPVRGAIVRPLIACTREEIEDFCKENEIPYVTDSTNSDMAFARNRIRQTVIPALTAINPRANEAFARAMAAAYEDDVCCMQMAEQALQHAGANGGYATEDLRKLPRAVRLRALQIIARQGGAGEITLMHLEALDALLAQSGAFNLPGGVRAMSLKKRLFLDQTQDSPSNIPLDFSVQADGKYRIGNKIYAISTVSREEYEKKKKIHKNLFKNALSYDMIGKDLFLRQRRTGDYLHPAGRACGKSVKKLLNELAIPPYARDEIPILCDSTGILCVVGICCDERVRITENTKSVLLIEETERTGNHAIA